MSDGKVTIFHEDGRVVIEPMDIVEYEALVDQWSRMGDDLIRIENDGDNTRFAFHPVAINSMMWEEQK
jgi:hypothetical protein